MSALSTLARRQHLNHGRGDRGHTGKTRWWTKQTRGARRCFPKFQFTAGSVVTERASVHRGNCTRMRWIQGNNPNHVWNVWVWSPSSWMSEASCYRRLLFLQMSSSASCRPMPAATSPRARHVTCVIHAASHQPKPVQSCTVGDAKSFQVFTEEPL